MGRNQKRHANVRLQMRQLRPRVRDRSEDHRRAAQGLSQVSGQAVQGALSGWNQLQGQRVLHDRLQRRRQGLGGVEQRLGFELRRGGRQEARNQAPVGGGQQNRGKIR